MTMRHRLLPLALAALAACDAAEITAPAVEPSAGPAMEIYHWPSFGTKGFYFLNFWDLPPGSVEAPFDPAVQPTVRICRITSGACGPTLATFTRTSGSYGQRVSVDVAGQAYNVTWPTGSTGVQAGQVYRVTVLAAGRELGYMDVRMVSSIWEYFFNDWEEYRPWFPGWNLPISFRIQEDIPGSIVLSTSSIAVGVDEGVPLTGQVLDLHGQPLGTEVGWVIINTSAASGAVATLDSGLVVGGEPGTALIFAYVEDVALTVPVTVTDNRFAWTAAMATPDNQGNRALWGTATNNVFAANHTGVLRYDGAAWTHVEAVRWRSMRDVFGLGANSVFAVGDAGMILRFDGSAWSAVRYDGTTVSPYALDRWDPPARNITLRAAWGFAPSTVVAVGDSGTALVFDGSQWTAFATGVTADFTDIWGTGPTNIYLTTSDGRLLHFNGSALSTVAGVSAPGAMHAVWGTSASNVYAVGAGGALFRFNGSSWQRIRLPTRPELYAVWGSSSSNVFVAGEGGKVYRFNGSAWVPEKSPGGGSQIFGLWGASGSVYAAGAGGLIARR